MLVACDANHRSYEAARLARRSEPLDDCSLQLIVPLQPQKKLDRHATR